MRQIKFRALRDDMSNFKFVYGNLIYRESGEPRIQENNRDLLFTSCIKGTEGQFTGLTDKNGVDIYEGDICIVENNGLETIKWNKEYCCFDTEQGNGLEKSWELEVIGNIHKNKDLES